MNKFILRERYTRMCRLRLTNVKHRKTRFTRNVIQVEQIHFHARWIRALTVGRCFSFVNVANAKKNLVV